MNNPKSYLFALIAIAVAAFGGAFSLLGIAQTALEVAVIAEIMIASVGLMVISYRELAAMEDAEKQDEHQRQEARDKVQEDIRDALNDLNSIFRSQQLKEETENMVKAIQRRTRTAPNVEKLQLTETQSNDEENEDLPPESGSATSQS